MKNLTNVLFALCMTVLSMQGQEFSYKENKKFDGFDQFVLEAEFSPFRNYFALSTGSNQLVIYNKDWEKVIEYQGNSASLGGYLDFSPDEQLLAYSKYKYINDIAIIRLSDMKVIQLLTEPKGSIYDLKFSPDGNWLAACGEDKTIRLWKREGDNFEFKYTLSDNDRSLFTIEFNSKSNILVSGGQDYKVNIYKIGDQAPEIIQTFKIKGYVRGIAFHPLDDMFVMGTDNAISFYNRKGEKYDSTASIEIYNINQHISFSPKGEYLVFGDRNDLVVMQKERSEYVQKEIIVRHSDHVFGGCFSNDGKFLVTKSSDKSAIIWEVENVEPSNKSLLVQYYGKDLTYAQKKVIDDESVDIILGKLNTGLTLPKNEFETSEEFLKRRETLSIQILNEVQKLLEEKYISKTADQKNRIILPIQKLISYNADLQIYKIKFMDTDAGVEIPVEAAKSLKLNFKKAYVQITKEPDKAGYTYTYKNFELVHPDNQVYKIIPVENPFQGKSDVIDTRNFTSYSKPVIENKENTQDTLTFHSSQALLFASNIYDSYNELLNPVFDARTIATELENNYNSYVETVENPTLNDLITKIREYAGRTYSENEFLLIFIAGHGTYDEVFKEGYVVLRDSKFEDVAKTSYLSHSNLRTMVNNIPCNHILLVMDVCFGGTFDPLVASRDRSASSLYSDVSEAEYLRRKMKYKTRYYLTSGGKEYVPDGRPGQHSPFARRFIESLRNYGGTDHVLNLNEIIQFVEKVDPQPCFGEFGNNEPGSDFLLIAK